MQTMKFCQSCAMPLENEDVMGTFADGSINEEYCIYCYKYGLFTEDVTMQEMIDISLKHMKELYADKPDFDEKEALAMMKEFFPELKRWKK